MSALILDCTLKVSPEPSNTDALLDVGTAASNLVAVARVLAAHPVPAPPG